MVRGAGKTEDGLVQYNEEVNKLGDDLRELYGNVGEILGRIRDGTLAVSYTHLKTLFRGDRASVVPDDVFKNGFKPKGTHNDALLHTKSNTDRKSTRLNSSHSDRSRMPSSA